MKKLFSILFPPHYENEEKARLAAYVHYICLAMFGGYLLQIAYDHLFGLRAISYVLYLSEASVAITIAINRKGYTRSAMLLVIVVNLFITATLMLLSNGTHDEIIILFPVILFVSCLLFDDRILLGAFILILLIIWTIGLLEINHVIVNKYSFSTSLMQLTFITLILTISVFVINLLVEDFKSMIRDFKQKTVELEVVNAKLNESNITKDKFISILAHDLRSPFQGILGISNILEFDDTDLTESERKKFISKLNKTLNRQYNFLEELLLWGKLQQGVVEFLPRKCNMKDIISDNVDVLSGNIAKKNLNLEVQGPDKVEAIIDDNLISTVIRNLLSNAIKFTPAGGSINIYLEDFIDHFSIKVSDTGIGVHLNRQKKLLKLETNTSTRGTEDEPGTGLGLILCKEIIEKHRGQLLIESEEGKGSSFTIILAKDTSSHNETDTTVKD
jgi:signal transduction histidine kinase